jgi:integrase
MTQRKLLTDKSVRALKPAAAGKRYDAYDTLIPNLLVRTTSSGHKTFALRAKFPGKKGRIRRELGEFGRLTCDDARTKARRWLSSLAQGQDPQLTERREQGRAVTVADALEQWLALRVRDKQRKARDVEREMKTYVLPDWGKLPVGSITRADVKQLVAKVRDQGKKGRGALYVAHTVLGHIRTFFDWAVDEERFGLPASPAAGIKPAKFIGAKKPRKRLLSDDELRALWRSADQMGYPYGPLFQLLLLTGCRNSEVRCAPWSEFDLGKKLWTIPPERFKSDGVHLVPLSSAALELLAALPRFQGNDFLFSNSFGKAPVGSLGKAKPKLDQLMAEELGRAPEPWVVHDLRRAVRSRLASLRVPDNVAEMVLGHAKKGMQRVYDLHSYEPEMRDALERWAKRLMAIVNPPSGDNVVTLREAAR